MGPIEHAIDEFRATRLKVYQVDPVQIVRDARAAERAAADHVGRWFFELFQNCDDAGAEEVTVVVRPEAVYVADNGRGLAPGAIKSICGTDYSDKPAGTIGRKGVGFKAVYELTQNPQVFTTGDEGFEFSVERAREWLAANDFDRDAIPYQWIPFFLSRPIAENADLELARLRQYKTVVKLPLASLRRKEKAQGQLDWPTHALLAFQHVRKLEVRDAETGTATLRLRVEPQAESWLIEDSRLDAGRVRWRVARHCEHPPEDVLGGLGHDEQQRIKEDGISVLIATPLGNDGRLVPTSEHLPVHVFYPTEQKGPVRLLLHAEFLVKSDRTALIPIDDSPFNTWVAEQLAYRVCEFVQNAYLEQAPSRNLALLVPFEDRETHPVAGAIWDHIARLACERLRLGNVDGDPCLAVADAKLLSVSVGTDCARRLLEGTPLRGQLAHHSFDVDKDARKALGALCCEHIRDEDVMRVITESAGQKADDREWTWACWDWAAAWVNQEPYGEEHRSRVDRAKNLPIVPVARGPQTPAALEGRIVTWRSDGQEQAFPEWLPLVFVDDWFRDRTCSTATDAPVRKFLKDLGICEPSGDVLQRAVGYAIDQYWKEPDNRPGRFLEYVLAQDWHKTSEPREDLRRCPVPASRDGVQSIEWVEAHVAYFGADWGNDLLAQLYAGDVAVPWMRPSGSDAASQEERDVLTWLGVADCPRVVSEPGEKDVWQLPEDCNGWKKYLETARDSCGRPVERIISIDKIDRLAVDRLDRGRAIFLIRMIAKHWDGYYLRKAESTAQGTYGREQYYPGLFTIYRLELNGKGLWGY